ncbi:Uncharacterized protein TCM_023620 [Theobroma cacao]|uniref:Uncharacterized protein n=1 Tax=Theobroma cacao TaxID=3641 RepID=A0A061EV61_THECC|nr:Uncharacterized protein TCM_023620 [Theobroma cacao]
MPPDESRLQVPLFTYSWELPMPPYINRGFKSPFTYSWELPMKPNINWGFWFPFLNQISIIDNYYFVHKDHT